MKFKLVLYSIAKCILYKKMNKHFSSYKSISTICWCYVGQWSDANHVWHRWFSGRMFACHADGPGSIPGRCKSRNFFDPFFDARTIFSKPFLVWQSTKIPKKTQLFITWFSARNEELEAQCQLRAHGKRHCYRPGWVEHG